MCLRGFVPTCYAQEHIGNYTLPFQANYVKGDHIKVYDMITTYIY